MKTLESFLEKQVFLKILYAKIFRNYQKSFFSLLIALTLSFSLQAKDIYVAKNGSDSNAGTQNAPFKTIAKASSVARAGDIVIIGAGTYEELLEPARSGTPGNPIVYRAKTGEKVIITAMQAVNNWIVDQGNIYKATVNWDLGQDNMALHNDNLMDLARWPNNVPQNLFKRDYLPACNRGAAGGGKTWMNYNGSQSNGHANSIPHASKWKNGGSIHFYGGAGFLAWTDFITNSSSNRIDFKLQRRQNWIQLRHHPGYTGHGVKKGEFFLQGIKEALDYKNEWFYDKNNKTLYVQIDGGGAPAANSIRFRRRTQTIKLNKNYIHIENLAVFGGSIDISGNNNKLSRVSSFYGNHTLGVIDGFDSRRQSVLITGNKNTIERCEIAWGAGNGVYDKGDDNKLLNSYVHDFNYLGNYDCVLNTRGAKRGSYRNNTLTRSGKDIIQAYVDGGEFAYNDISLNNFVADDGGLLYTTNARATKSSIHHNTFHDSQARNGRFKGTGIYLDNDSKNWDVYNNVVWNTKWTNIQINWNGTNLKIYNNTFAKGSATMGAWHKAGTRFSNVQVWNNITDKEAVDQQGNQESESTWEPQSDKQNNLVSRASFNNYNNNDYTLKRGAQAIDFGRVIAGYTDGFQGRKPDAGAYESGLPPFKTGINWNIASGPTGLGCYGLPGEATNCNPGGGGGNTASVTAVNISDNNVTLNINQTRDLNATVIPDNATDKSVTWSSNNTSIATVNSNGLVRAISEGSAIITVTTTDGNKKATSTINVTDNTSPPPPPSGGDIVIEAETFTNTNGTFNDESDGGPGLGMNATAIGVNYVNSGDWSEYTINVGTAGEYSITYQISTPSDNAQIQLLIDDTVVATDNVSNNGNWDNYTALVSSSTIANLSSGRHTVRVVASGSNPWQWNLDKIVLRRIGGNDGGGNGQSTTVTLAPIHDAYMQGNTRQNINIIRLEKNKRVAYLMFDLSSVNGTIKEASLNFTVNSDAGNGEVTIYKGNNNNWTEQNLSNNNKPAKSGVLGSINSTYAIGNTKTVSLQPASISGNKVSFILEAVSGNDFAFASKEHGSAAKPELVLTYEGTRRENNELINSFEIYPNPTEDIITFTSDMTNKRIKLYDMLGRLQRNIVFKKGENTLDLSVLESGYYLLNILDTEKSNEVIATKKLIKQ